MISAAFCAPSVLSGLREIANILNVHFRDGCKKGKTSFILSGRVANFVYYTAKGSIHEFGINYPVHLFGHSLLLM
jgi:hypothetical protein